MTDPCKRDIDGIGIVYFRQSKRAKHLIISVSPSKGVRISVPMRTSFKKALDFVYFKRDWVKTQIAEIEKIKNQKVALSNSLLPIDEAEAKKRLITRLYNLAEKHGFTYGRVTIRDQKTRWGSCSFQNNISLNIKLVLIPEELIDYVILHELVHTRIHNHGKEFWAELDKYVGDAKTKAKIFRRTIKMSLIY